MIKLNETSKEFLLTKQDEVLVRDYEPIKVEMLQCPHCSKKMKTRSAIKKHISNCRNHPRFWGSPNERGTDSKSRVFEKRPRVNTYKNIVALFVDGRFAYIIEIDGKLPNFIKYPRKFDFKFKNLRKPFNKKTDFVTDLIDSYNTVDVTSLSGCEKCFDES